MKRLRCHLERLRRIAAFRHPWTAENLAREVGLSRSAFAHRFNRLIGHPPMRYLARQRMIQAAVLLRETTDPVARIAYEVGYESEAAFNRAFKREHGASAEPKVT